VHYFSFLLTVVSVMINQMFTLASRIKHAPKLVSSSTECLFSLYACTYYPWKYSDFQYSFVLSFSSSSVMRAIPSAAYVIIAKCVLPAYRKSCVVKCIV